MARALFLIRDRDGKFPGLIGSLKFQAALSCVVKHQDGLHYWLGGGSAGADRVHKVAWPDYDGNLIAFINLEGVRATYGVLEFESDLVNAASGGLYRVNSPFQWNTAFPFHTRRNSSTVME